MNYLKPKDVWNMIDRGSFYCFNRNLFRIQAEGGVPDEWINKVFSSPRSGVINPLMNKNWKDSVDEYLEYIHKERKKYKNWYIESEKKKRENDKKTYKMCRILCALLARFRAIPVYRPSSQLLNQAGRPSGRPNSLVSYSPSAAKKIGRRRLCSDEATRYSSHDV